MRIAYVHQSVRPFAAIRSLSACGQLGSGFDECENRTEQGAELILKPSQMGLASAVQRQWQPEMTFAKRQMLALMNAVSGQEGPEFTLKIRLKRLTTCRSPVDADTHRYRRAIPQSWQT